MQAWKLQMRLRGKGILVSTGLEIPVSTTCLSSAEAVCRTDYRPRVGDAIQLCLDWPMIGGGTDLLEGFGSVSAMEIRSGRAFEVHVNFLDCPHLLKNISSEVATPEAHMLETPEILKSLPVEPEAFHYYRRLGRVQDFVLEHYTEPIPLKRAAQVAGMEETYFSDFFSRKVGVPFTRWLSEVRIGRAIELIQGGNHSITFVAHEVGFSNLRTFERAFRKRTGMTPAHYRRLVRPS
ncbi:MAG TPA: AraC family transcriptional regulator [Acidobacteriota bacterium]|nr:AraC family transcriptional regulator [Acidobacteriota bacterium]